MLRKQVCIYMYITPNNNNSSSNNNNSNNNNNKDKYKADQKKNILKKAKADHSGGSSIYIYTVYISPVFCVNCRVKPKGKN